MTRFPLRIGPAVLAIVVATAVGAGALAQGFEPTFRPDRLKGSAERKPNEVLVLGTTHLSSLPDTFRPAGLTPLLDRLAAWRPAAIATEDLSGLECDMLRRHPYRYTASTLDYCPDPSAAGHALGLDVPTTNAEAERTLAAWPAAPAPAQRRRLAAVFLAAGEPGSALVQWLRLAPAERRAGDGLTDPLVQMLEKRRVRRNETTLVAAPLAARLGLERLWSVDDHSADLPTPPDEEQAYEAAITRAWDNPVVRERMAWNKPLEAGIDAPGGVLALYRAYNSPRAADLAFRSDFGAALDEPSPQGYGRGYVGWWETRNLRMVANIRDVLARRPGTRLLAIVGASHKGYYEAYLNQMHDVRLADTAAILK
jgi:hypothetical protein